MKSTCRLTVLVDNHAPAGMAAEHGFSLWWEAGEERILFDTGQGRALPDNAAALGIDLAAADAIVLSHGHYDHSGGLPQALSAAGNAPVYFHPAVTRSRFSIRDGKAKPIGMPVASRLALASVPGSRLFRVEEPLAPWNGVGLSGPIPRCTDFEDVGGPFFLDAGGSEPDPVSDDLAAWIRTAEGLVVILGCCHAGLVNTVTHCREQSGENRIAAIIGGMHLGEAGPERLARTVAALAALRPALLVPCHCTGENAVAALQDAFPGRTTPGLVGESFRFSVAAG